jgi:hypothetical protein
MTFWVLLNGGLVALVQDGVGLETTSQISGDGVAAILV